MVVIEGRRFILERGYLQRLEKRRSGCFAHYHREIRICLLVDFV